MKISDVDSVDIIIISLILNKYFGKLNYEDIFDEITEFEYKKNLVGHRGYFGYRDRNLETDNFWSRNQNLVRCFHLVILLNNLGPFGARVVFYENRPFDTELYAMGADVPENIKDVSIVSVCEG